MVKQAADSSTPRAGAARAPLDAGAAHAPLDAGGAQAHAPSGPLARSIGGCRLTFDRAHGGTRLKTRDQRAPARLLTPRDRAVGIAGATLVNEAGGLAGGDRLDHAVEVGAGASAIVTSQAAEKVYRSTGPASVLSTELRIADDAWAEWLPQETILFDRAHLIRRTHAQVAAQGRLLAGELTVLGRTARGERAQDARLLETWRVQRAGRLAWADGLRLAPPNAGLDAPAGFDGCAALGTLIYVAPDAGDQLATAREILAGHAGRDVRAGVTQVAGLLLVRVLAPAGAGLRRTVAGFWADFRAEAGGLPARVPAAWHT
jgi:urease accessory protein